MPYKDPVVAEKYNQEYLIKNKEYIRKKARERYLKKVDEKRKYSLEYYRDNKDYVLKYRKEYYQKNKSRIYTDQRIWQSLNKEKVNKIKARYRAKNSEKLKLSGIAYSREHKDERNVYRKEWRKKKGKEEKLLYQYGLTLFDYNAILKKQKNKCGLCKSDFDFKVSNKLNYPCVDHDHENNKVRGIVCRRCNSGLGGFKDSPSLVKKAFKWLNTARYNGQEASPGTVKGVKYNYECLIKRVYGISLNHFYGMMKSQKYKCGICEIDVNKSKGFNIDHCHVTGNIRGILCPKCNRALGQLKEDRKILKSAVRWLKRSQKKNI